MTKMNQLTTEQQAQLAPWRNQWLAHGLNTTPADRPRAENGVRLAYKNAGLEPPRIFIWLDSPLAGCYGAALLANLPEGAQVGDQVGDQVGAQVWAQVWAQVGDQVWAQVWAQVGDQVWAQVWAQVGDQVGDQVRAQVWAQVGDQVWAQVWAQVGDQVWAQVWAQVGDQVWAQVWAQVGAQVRDQVSRAIYGQHEAGWLSFYDYMHRIVGINEAARLDGISEVACSAGWWWPFQGAVILTERPTELHRDAENRLHCETGPALRYLDGWSIWAWHGTRVPEWVIMGPSADSIHAEPNVEIRRCAIERLGWDQYVAQAGLELSEPIDDPGNSNQQLRLSQPLDIFGETAEELVRILLCTNGTIERGGIRRRFGLTVPATISDPVEAAAWSYGWPIHTYRQLQRRT